MRSSRFPTRLLLPALLTLLSPSAARATQARLVPDYVRFGERGEAVVESLGEAGFSLTGSREVEIGTAYSFIREPGTDGPDAILHALVEGTAGLTSLTASLILGGASLDGFFHGALMGVTRGRDVISETISEEERSAVWEVRLDGGHEMLIELRAIEPDTIRISYTATPTS